MDFIKGNEQVKIDPSGIDISGTGKIILRSDGNMSLTGTLTGTTAAQGTNNTSMATTAFTTTFVNNMLSNNSHQLYLHKLPMHLFSCD